MGVAHSGIGYQSATRLIRYRKRALMVARPALLALTADGRRATDTGQDTLEARTTAAERGSMGKSAYRDLSTHIQRRFTTGGNTSSSGSCIRYPLSSSTARSSNHSVAQSTMLTRLGGQVCLHASVLPAVQRVRRPAVCASRPADGQLSSQGRCCFARPKPDHL